MKTLTTFSNETEARITHDLLAAKGIPSQVIGAKEYVAHVMGGNDGRYKILVEEDDLKPAQKIMAEVLSRKTDDGDSMAPNYFGRALFFAIAATVIFPLGFNLVSILNIRYFWKTTPHNSNAVLRLSVLLLMQLPGLTIPFFIFRTW